MCALLPPCCGPLEEGLLVSVGEFRLRMHYDVVPLRHLPLLHLLPGLLKLLQLPFLVVPVPLGEVKLDPPLRDVVREEPGRRGYVGIPRPHGLVRMAVVAGAPEHLLHTGRGVYLARYRRVRPLYGYELDTYERNYQHSRDYLYIHRFIYLRLLFQLRLLLLEGEYYNGICRLIQTSQAKNRSKPLALEPGLPGLRHHFGLELVNARAPVDLRRPLGVERGRQYGLGVRRLRPLLVPDREISRDRHVPHVVPGRVYGLVHLRHVGLGLQPEKIGQHHVVDVEFDEHVVPAARGFLHLYLTHPVEPDVVLTLELGRGPVLERHHLVGPPQLPP